MNADAQSHWSQALRELGAMLDLDADARETQLAILRVVSPEVAAMVEKMLAVDALDAMDDSQDELSAAPAPVIDGYRVIRWIGRGGMGDVFEAERAVDASAQMVALKCMREDQTQAGRARFLRERQILARLQHANIARLIDAGFDEQSRPWMAMELVRGEALAHYVARRGLDIAARIRLHIVVCRAVAHAHRKLVIHCDLKPGNVMVDAEGQVKLLDFGISKLLADDAQASATLSMTPAYAAPEQLLGEPLTVATDVYALGLLLLELLVGPLPVRGLRDRMREAAADDGEELRPSALAVATDTGDTPGGITTRRRLARALTGDLDLIVVSALRRDPGRRYRDAEALAEDLVRYLDGRPILARRDDWRYRTRKFLTRHRWTAAFTAITATLLVAATVVSLRFAAQARSALISARIAQEASATEARRAIAMKDFLVSTLTEASPLNAPNGQGVSYSAADLLSAAAQRVDGTMLESPESEGEILNALAKGLEALGRYDQALVLAEKSIAVTGHLPPSMMRVNGMHARARLLNLMGRPVDARDEAHATLALLAKVRPGAVRETAQRAMQLHQLLALIARNLGDHETARNESEATLRDHIELLGNDQDEALAVDWNNLAHLDVDIGRYRDAELGYSRAIEIYGKANGVNAPRMAWLHDGRGTALLGLGDLDGAERELNLALAITASRLGKEHPVMGDVQRSLGDLARARGDPATALDHHRRALSIFESHHKRVHTVQLRIGADLLSLGKDLEAQSVFDSVAKALAEPGSESASAWTALAALGQAVIRVRHGDGQSLAQARAALDAVAQATGSRTGPSFRLGASILALAER